LSNLALRETDRQTPAIAFTASVVGGKQELSYRKQIARKLRRQYVEDIYRPKYYTVTLKSRLRVTHGHWKRNHWIDYTRLTISLVFDVEYYCDLEMWVRGHSRWYHLKAWVRFPNRLP